MTALRRIDFWSAVTFFLLGVVVISLASAFDEKSRSYPLFLAIALCVLSAGLLVQGLVSRSAKTVDRDEVEIVISGPGVQTLLWTVWVALLSVGAGYLGPSVLVVGSIIVALRGGSPAKSLLQSLAIVAVVFFMFYVIFDIPLPVLDIVDEILG
ncbi:MAG: tripartite tricarboxylate transporter TctB family protein [Rhodospirillales bacterium]|nr:tripartite tricarboxylate transporter TctB family protein [Rhodospirillales bacterium]